MKRYSYYYYVGLDLHKKKITYCVKTKSGKEIDKGEIAATKPSLAQWAQGIRKTWIGAMEATLFTGWVYDLLKPYAKELKVANPLMLKAIAASKKKNDRVDAQKICDLLRVDLLPECYMAPRNLRELRRVLRYRNSLVEEATRFKNKTSGLLMSLGVEYDRKKLHGRKYFNDLMDNLEDMPGSVKHLLRLNRESLDAFTAAQRQLLTALHTHRLLKDRVARLMSIPGVGVVMALTWALEIGEPERFRQIRHAISYCGLCSAQKESGGKTYRGPISKQRNAHLQWILIECAHMARLSNPQLRDVYERELKRGSKNRATLAVARKLVGFLLAIDKSGKKFVPGLLAA